MSQRIGELEHSAQMMETSLRQEHQLASTDPLTGLANRAVFQQRIALTCAEVARGNKSACLLVLDIDHFKQINDRFGHAAGDRALRIVAEHLTARLRAGDLLARYGGEEFVVVLPGTPVQAGLGVAQELRTCIEGISFRGQQQPVRITLSCGVTALRADDTPERAFERADRALYRAKHNGRNRCELA
jgi:diguanylate cyclase